MHKGFSAGDERLIRSIPDALAQTEFVCSSVNVGSTKSGINMDAVKMMGPIIKAAAEKTKDNMCMGAAKLVVFCNAPEDNPFMAGAFHGPGEPDCVVHVGVSGPGAVRAALAKLPRDASLDKVAELIKRTAFKITRMGQLVGNLASEALGVPFGIVDLSLAPHACRGRFRGQYSGRNWPGKLRLLRHHGHAGHAERRREKRRRHGLEPCGWAFGRVHPVSEDDGMIKAARARQPFPLKSWKP